MSGKHVVRINDESKELVAELAEKLSVSHSLATDVLVALGRNAIALDDEAVAIIRATSHGDTLAVLGETASALIKYAHSRKETLRRAREKVLAASNQAAREHFAQHGKVAAE